MTIIYIYSFKTVDYKLRVNVKNNIEELVFKIVAYYRIKIYDEINICMSIHFQSKLAKIIINKNNNNNNK